MKIKWNSNITFPLLQHKVRQYENKKFCENFILINLLNLE